MAVFRGQELYLALYVKNPMEEGRGYKAHVAMAQAYSRHTFHDPHPGPLVIEFQRVYPGMAKIDLNDLLDCTGVGAAIAAVNSRQTAPRELISVFPSEWKGNLKKQDMLARIRGKLSVDELSHCEFTNKSDNEDILDAVGIGLWKLGRLNKKVYPGAVP